MENAEHTGPNELTLLERVLQLQGDFRRSLDPIRVTPLQAGMILFLRRHPEARATDAARAFSLRLPTMVAVVQAMARKRWIIRRRSVTDTRIVHLSLSRQGQDLARKIDVQVRQMTTGIANKNLPTADRTRRHRVSVKTKGV